MNGDATVAGLRVVDVDNPSQPEALAFLALSGEPQGLALARLGADRYALVAAGAAGLHVVNVTDPDSPAACQHPRHNGQRGGRGGLRELTLMSPTRPAAWP